MSNATYELILAQEQGAVMREGGIKKELEAEFGGDTKVGTLVLTSKRLIFVCTDVKEEELPLSILPTKLQQVSVFYSEVEDLERIPKRDPNTFIPLDSIASTKGHKQGIERPSLEVTWQSDKGKKTSVFTETLTGRRKRNLNDWAQIISGLKAGTQKLVVLPESPALDTIEGKVLHVLADMQEKGIFAIEEAVEREYGIEVDPDEVQSACDRLSAGKLVTRTPDPSGDTFYRRVSPLGEDNPSS